jgi:hypothetical protein
MGVAFQIWSRFLAANMKEDYYGVLQEATNVGGFSDTPENDNGILFQGYTNPGHQIAWVTNFFCGT